MLIHRRRFLNSSGQFAVAVASLAYTPISGIFLRQDDRREQLFLAIERNDFEAVDRLLKEDKDLVNALDVEGRTPYTVAMLARQPKIAARIQEAGYQPDLHESALSLDWERFDQLIGVEKADTAAKVNAFHPLGGSTMHAAARGGAGTDMWRIYGVGGHPNVTFANHEAPTPLQVALRYPDLPTAEMTAATLLANAANPNDAGGNESPPLCIAVERGSLEMVEMLIRLGARLDSQSSDGKTLKELARLHHHESIEKLLDHPESVPLSSHSSRTAVDRNGKRYERPDMDGIHGFEENRFVGASHFDINTVKNRLEADPRLAHSVATTSEICVEACAHTGRREIVELLLNHNAPYSLPTAVMLEDVESVKRYIEEDPSRINERGAHDFPLLWYPLIGRTSLDTLALLVDLGAEVEHQHFLGTTALHWACRMGRIEVVEYLLDQGASPTRVGRKFSAEGETPIQLASGDDKAAIVAMLSKSAQATR